MRSLFFVLTVLGSCWGFAEVTSVPTAVIHQDVLGGDVLLIQMKDYLVITGKESQSLELELGANGKKVFTQDIVMGRSMNRLVGMYNPMNKKPTVKKILNRYSDLLLKLESKETLD
jgi:hypothetical protein